jgi:hypothetical protein
MEVLDLLILVEVVVVVLVVALHLMAARVL